jgi:acetyl esterase/lipase
MSIFKATCVYKQIHGLSIKIDVFPVPGAQKRTPVVMYIHGGCLMAGVRTDQSESTSLGYVQRGYAAASIDYRLAPETKLADIVGDVEDSLQWLRSEGARLFNLDPERICVAGSSAGGYLAQVTGTFAQKPRCIVTYSGYCDLLGNWYCKPDHFYRELYAGPGKKPALVTREEAFSHIHDHEVTEGDHGPLYLYCRQQGLWTTIVSGHDPETERDQIAPYCPALNVTGEYSPLFMMHGDCDTDVPYSQAVQMDAELTRCGVEHQLFTLHGAGHMLYQTGKKDELDKGTRESQEFLKKHLGQ